MPLDVPNTHTIRDPTFAETQMAMQFGRWLDVGEAILRYAADLLLRALRTSHDSLEDLVVIGTVFRQVIVAADGCLVCARAGAIQAAMLHTRAEFEASMALQWILERGKQHWARQFYVCSLRQMRSWANQHVPGTDEFKARELAWSGIADPPAPTAEQSRDASESVSEIERLLAREEYSVINDAFEREAWIGKGAKKRRREVNWYQPGGVTTIGAMARALNREAEYASLYRYASYFVHGSLTENHFVVRDSYASIEPIRYPKQFATAFNGTFMDVVQALVRITGEYREGELPALRARYDGDWKPALSEFANVTVEPQMVVF